MLGAGSEPQATVSEAGAVIVGKAAGLTVITRDTGANALPHASVAAQVSVTVPPQGPGIVENVDVLELPDTKQPPLKLLL